SSRFHLAIIRPSMTMLSACRSVGFIRSLPRRGAANLLSALWGEHIPGGRGDPVQKRLGYCRKRQRTVANGQVRPWTSGWEPEHSGQACSARHREQLVAILAGAG